MNGLCYLFVGRFIPLKGIHYLLEAWRLFCARQGGPATLVLAGDGEQRGELLSKVQQLGLTNVKFTGFIQHEKVCGLYKAAEVFASATLQDACSVSLSEALASGLLVIASKYDGASVDLVRDGANGWVVDPHDLNDLADKFLLAWQTRDRRAQMIEAGEDIVAGLDMANMVDVFRQAVETAVKGVYDRKQKRYPSKGGDTYVC